MSGHRVRLSVLVKPSKSGSNEDAANQSANPAKKMNNTAASKVGIAQAVQPSGRGTVPGPVAHGWVDPAWKEKREIQVKVL